MRIHQVTVRYMPEEDRLLLRINTMDRQELRFYLTRRFVRLLWPLLGRMLQEDQQRRHPVPAPAAADVLAFEQEKALSGANFEKRFEERPAAFPLGEQPVLLTRVQTGRRQAREVLSLMSAEGPGIELPAIPGVLHSLQRLIRESANRAQWDLDLTEPSIRHAENRSIH